MQPGMNISGLHTTLTDAIFLLTLSLFTIAWISGKTSLSRDPIHKYLAAFLLAMAPSAALSIMPRTGVLKLAGVGYLVCLVVLTINVVRNERMLKSAILVWITASTAAALIGAITVVLFYVDRTSPWHSIFLHHYGSLPVGNYPRIQSTFLYPAMLCNYLTAGILLILASFKLGWIKNKPTAFCLILHGIAAIFTLTPGLGGLVFAIALWVGFMIIEGKRPLYGKIAFAAGSLVFILSIAVSAFSIRPIATSPFTYDVFGVRIDPTQRLLAWRDAIETFIQHPLFGKGVGLGVANVRFQAPSGQMQILTDAHNTFLSIAGQAGILGSAAFFALMISTLRRGLISRIGEVTKVTNKPISLAMTIAFISGIAFQGMVGSFEDARHLWVLLGLIVAASRIDVPAKADR